ncbi:MAG: DUF1952 domain-containing protein [Chloroflexota bacterium]|jgi:hypothetical protein
METQFFVHAIPLWLLREYLEELGGQAESETVVAGDNWRAELAKLPDRQLGSLRVGRVELTLIGEPEALAALRPGLDRKTLRAGA